MSRKVVAREAHALSEGLLPGREDPAAGRVLRSDGLSPQVRDLALESAREGGRGPRTPAARADLFPPVPADRGGHLGGRGLSVVGPSQGPAAVVAAVGGETL